MSNETLKTQVSESKSETMVVIDALLLAIIRANPTTESASKRLEAAKLALFGIPVKHGNKPIDDIDLLMLIAKDYIKDRGTPNIAADWSIFWNDENPKNARSLRQLIRIHSENVSEHILESHEHWTCHSFVPRP